MTKLDDQYQKLTKFLTDFSQKQAERIEAVASTALSPKSDPQLDYIARHQLSKTVCQQSLALSQKIWSIALLTLPLDILLGFLPTPALNYIRNLPAFFPLTILCLGIGVLSVFKLELIKLIKSLQAQLQQKWSSQKMLVIVAGGLLLVGLVIELAMSQNSGFLAVLVQMIIYGSALASVLVAKRNSNSAQTYSTKLRRDYFILSSLPIIAARLLSPLMIIYSLPLFPNNPFLCAASLAALTAMLLLAYQPQAKDFMSSCKRCAQFVPANVFADNLCETCERQLL